MSIFNILKYLIKIKNNNNKWEFNGDWGRPYWKGGSIG